MLTNEQFREKLKQVNPTITTNTYYNGNKTIMQCKCQSGHTYETRAFNLIYNKNGCPICSGLKVNIGYNDMWTTNPELAKLLLNKEDGYKYSQASTKEVWWKCPCCGEHIYKKISNVYNSGLVCGKCSDGISFPNRFMYNTLKQLDIEFITEYIIEGSRYRYDFYLPKYNLIIEMQGKQHYYGWNFARITKEEIHNNDENKKIFALKNGIDKYIEIDAREGNKNHIVNSILSSELINIIDFSLVDWNKSLFESSKSFVKTTAYYYNQGLSISEIAERIKVSDSTIYRWIKIATELKLCDWKRSKGFLYDEKSVILLNTNKIYKSLSEASKDTGLNITGISDACRHKIDYFGLDKNYNPMVWMYLEDYKRGERIDIKKVYLTHRNGIPINQYTLEGIFIKTYPSVRIAKEETGITTIINVCSKRKYEAGGYRWYYIDDEKQPDSSKIKGNKRYYGEDKKYIGKNKTYHDLMNGNHSVSIDIYNRYGDFIDTCNSYADTVKITNCSKDQIYGCCSGRTKYAGEYVFRYHGDNFYKYYYPKEFSKYINVYEEGSLKFIGVYYSIPEVSRQLNISKYNIYKVLSKEKENAYGYYFYYACDLNQPDKTKIIMPNS